MSETTREKAPYVKCPDCPKDPDTCWLAPHLCSHPLRRIERLRAALDDAIRLADHWAPKDGPDAALAARELADLRAIANARLRPLLSTKSGAPDDG